MCFFCTLVSHEGLGMYTEHIPDGRITASSWFSSKHLPYYGRLDTNIGHGAWCAAVNDLDPYLEIDLEMEHSISGIITQGKYRLSSDKLGDAWVTLFSLSYARTREQWTYVTDVNTKQPIVSIRNLLYTLDIYVVLTISRAHKHTRVLQSSFMRKRFKTHAGEGVTKWLSVAWSRINLSPRSWELHCTL